MKQTSLEECAYSNETLEQISMFNAVNFYREEFEKIMAGVSAVELFTTNERNRLIRHGILDVVHEGVGRKTIITEKAKWFMEQEET